MIEVLTRETCKKVLMCQMSADQRCCTIFYDNVFLHVCEDTQDAVVANVCNKIESALIGFRMSSTLIWMVLPVQTWLWGVFIDSGHVFLKCMQLLCFKRRYKMSFNTSHPSLVNLWEIHRSSAKILKSYLAVTETPSCKGSSQGWILNSMSMLKRHEQGRPYPVHYFLRRRSWRQNWLQWRQNRFVVSS